MQRVLLAVLPAVAAPALRLLGCTLRFVETYEPGARPADRAPKAPDIYVFWHRILLLAAYRYRDLGIRILISASFDGELIARTVTRLGFVPVRGSSSRGGAAGLLALTRARQSGYKVAITADGPRGPVHQAKAGAAAVAQHTGTTASCFHLESESAWLLKSWDRFVVPKPFSRVAISWCAPVELAGASTSAQATEHVQTSLERAVANAEALLQARPGRPS